VEWIPELLAGVVVVLMAAVHKVMWDRLTSTRDALYRHVESCAARNEQEAVMRGEILQANATIVVQLSAIERQLGRNHDVQERILEKISRNSEEIAILKAKGEK
jgi:hypothetical protein